MTSNTTPTWPADGPGAGHAPPGTPSVNPSAGQRLIADALVNYSGLAVSVATGILMVPVMLSHLGATLYGLWLAALTLSATLRTVDFGLGTVVIREMAGSLGGALRQRTVHLVNAAGAAHLLLGVAGASVLISCTPLFVDTLRLPAGTRELALPVFALAGLAHVGELGIGFGGSVLTGLRRFSALNGILIVLTLVRAGGIAALLLLDYSMLQVAAWHAGATLLGAAWTLIVMRSNAPGYRPNLPGRPWRALRRHTRFGLASFASGMATSATWQALPLLSAVLLGAGGITTVHVAQRIPLALTSLYGRVSSVVFPAATQFQHSSALVATQSILQTGSRLVLHLMIPMTTFGILAAPALIRLWLDDADPELILIFRLTLLAVLADALGSVAGNVLWGRGRVAPVLAVAVGSALATLCGAALLLPSLGAPGGAAVLGAVLTTGSLIFWVLACRAAGVHCIAFASQTLRGIGPATLGCGATVLACMAVPWIGDLPRLGLAAAACACGYFWIIGRFGTTPDERRFLGHMASRCRQQLLDLGRRIGARSPTLRSLGYLALAMTAAVRHPTSRMAEDFDQTFATAPDPWHYGGPTQRERVEVAMREVDELLAASGRTVIDRVLEIGCAEGTVTELLALRSRQLVAIDLSTVALDRARQRCAALPHARFHQATAAEAAAWGPYDLVVAMDVLECIRSPLALGRTREAIVNLLPAGGYLLVTTTRQHPVPESAWWGRWLPIGTRINEYVARHPQLDCVRSRMTTTHAVTLYRKHP